MYSVGRLKGVLKDTMKKLEPRTKIKAKKKSSSWMNHLGVVFIKLLPPLQSNSHTVKMYRHYFYSMYLFIIPQFPPGFFSLNFYLAIFKSVIQMVWICLLLQMCMHITSHNHIYACLGTYELQAIVNVVCKLANKFLSIRIAWIPKNIFNLAP